MIRKFFHLGLLLIPFLAITLLGLWLQLGRPSISSLIRPQTSNDFFSVENENPDFRISIGSEQKVAFLKRYLAEHYSERSIGKVKITITNVPQRVNESWESMNGRPVFYAGYASFFQNPNTVQVNLFVNRERLRQAVWTAVDISNELEFLLYNGLVIQFQTSANRLDPHERAKQVKAEIDAATPGQLFLVRYE